MRGKLAGGEGVAAFRPKLLLDRQVSWGSSRP